jgi:hypothetical protein
MDGYMCVLGLYCSASARWAVSIVSEPARSAMARLTFRTLGKDRAFACGFSWPPALGYAKERDITSPCGWQSPTLHLHPWPEWSRVNQGNYVEGVPWPRVGHSMRGVGSTARWSLILRADSGGSGLALPGKRQTCQTGGPAGAWTEFSSNCLLSSGIDIRNLKVVSIWPILNLWVVAETVDI